eukprot:g30254.t1
MRIGGLERRWQRILTSELEQRKQAFNTQRTLEEEKVAARAEAAIEEMGQKKASEEVALERFGEEEVVRARSQAAEARGQQEGELAQLS